MLSQIIGFFKLIRLRYLFFIGLAQYLAHYFIIVPILENYSKQSSLDNFEFFLLVLSTILIAAAGNIINDYFDVATDSHKPNRLIVGKVIARRPAMALHLVFNFLGMAIGFYLAWTIGNWKIGFVHFLTAGLLWFYSTSYNRKLIIGNLIVALLTGLAVVVVFLYESVLYYALSTRTMLAVGHIMKVIFAYSFFAFTLALIREIVKDLEDMEMHLDLDFKTIPISFGVRTAKLAVTALCIIVIVGIGYIQLMQMVEESFAPFTFLLAGIQLPSIYVIVMINQAQSKTDFNYIGNIINVVMLLGILSMLFFYYLVA